MHLTPKKPNSLLKGAAVSFSQKVTNAEPPGLRNSEKALKKSSLTGCTNKGGAPKNVIISN